MNWSSISPGTRITLEDALAAAGVAGLAGATVFLVTATSVSDVEDPLLAGVSAFAVVTAAVDVAVSTMLLAGFALAEPVFDAVCAFAAGAEVGAVDGEVAVATDALGLI